MDWRESVMVLVWYVCVQCQSKQPAVTLIPAAAGLDWGLSVSRKPWFITSRQAHGDRARAEDEEYADRQEQEKGIRIGKVKENNTEEKEMWKGYWAQHSDRAEKSYLRTNAFTIDQPRRSTSASVCDQLPVSLMDGTTMQSSRCFWEGSASKTTWL